MQRVNFFDLPEALSTHCNKLKTTDQHPEIESKQNLQSQSNIECSFKICTGDFECPWVRFQTTQEYLDDFDSTDINNNN